MFNTTDGLSRLGYYYAQALVDSDLEYDCLFGPAYKGIPLVSSLACALHSLGRDSYYCFNRKEKKDHGEGGLIVGKMTGRVLVVDDVITAGTAIRESMQIIQQEKCVLGGVLIALDRQEKGTGDSSAIQQIEREYATRVVAICTLGNVVEYLKENGGFSAEIAAIEKYRMEYGI